MIVIRVSALMQFILKQTTKKPINKVQQKNIFSNFCFKLDKADADILKKYIQIDFKNNLITAS